MRETKFAYKDKVIIKSGFYRGHKGKILGDFWEFWVEYVRVYLTSEKIEVMLHAWEVEKYES
jgi:hypothetical protein